MRGVSWLACISYSILMRPVFVLVSLALACAPSGPAPDERPIPGAVVAEEYTETVLHPCTRPGPAPIDSIWSPDSSAIRQFEAGLAAYLRSASYQRPGHGPTFPLSQYRGWFAGFVQGRTQWIYGAFARQTSGSMTAPMAFKWCDGGGAYFGVEFNPLTREYRNLARNGVGSVVEQ